MCAAEMLLEQLDDAAVDANGAVANWPELVETALAGVCDDDDVADTLVLELEQLRLTPRSTAASTLTSGYKI